VVQRALQAAVAACIPGRRYRDVHNIAARTICEGLAQAGLLRGDAATLAARNAHALFFPHGVGHLIGLDVHDMEDFGDLAGYAPGRKRASEFGTKFLRLDRDIAPGYCVTIEPGIYLVPAIWERDDLVGPLADVINRPAVDALLRDGFGGIRIEHTIAVRGIDGPEVLTADLPTDVDDVARLLP
jgi:Xaa-Pro aminopeptidase